MIQRFFINTVFFISAFFAIPTFAMTIDVTQNIYNGVEYTLDASHQNKEITFSKKFDAVSVKAFSPVEISFDQGKTWKILTLSDENTANESFSELFILPASVDHFRFKTSEKSVIFQIFAIETQKPFFAGTVDIGIGYSRDESFFQNLGIVKREAWGADESIRFVVPTPTSIPTLTPEPTPWKPTPTPSAQDIQCEAWQAAAPEDFKTSASVYYENGKKLAWPHRYSPVIKKIFIHHTAESMESLSTRTEAEIMQAIYKYHAKNKGWGDIGYNFVIGPSGTIYEGKAGGDYIMGGHVYCANAQSMGISLMGNFETGTPSVEQIKALEKLLKELSQKYNINISGTSSFHGETTPNVLGHKDFGSTACPGKFLYALLPAIRTNTVDYAKLSQDSIFSPPTSAVTPVWKAKLMSNKIIRQMAKINTTPTSTISIQNTGNTTWQKGIVSLQIKRLGVKQNIPMNEVNVPPNAVATFTIKAFEPLSKNQNYTITLQRNKKNISGGRAKWKLTPLESPLTSPIPTPLSSSISSSSDSENIRILLSYPENIATVSGDPLSITLDGKTITGGLNLNLSTQKNQVLVNNQILANVVRLSSDSGILTIDSWERQPTWNKSLNDNQFRGVLELRSENGKLMVINELPLESYLKGIAEVSDSAPTEKQKAIAVIARTYAAFYMNEINRKYPGKPYDGDDSPESFQKYLGYGYEKRSPHFSQAVDATKNQVVMFLGNMVKTPYFSESDGRTRSAKEVWGWDNTPYLKAVDDTHCKKGKGILQGHGVGLSGCGAESMANEGFNYQEILKYYYTGVEVNEK